MSTKLSERIAAVLHTETAQEHDDIIDDVVALETALTTARADLAAAEEKLALATDKGPRYNY